MLLHLLKDVEPLVRLVVFEEEGQAGMEHLRHSLRPSSQSRLQVLFKDAGQLHGLHISLRALLSLFSGLFKLHTS